MHDSVCGVQHRALHRVGAQCIPSITNERTLNFSLNILQSKAPVMNFSLGLMVLTLRE